MNSRLPIDKIKTAQHYFQKTTIWINKHAVIIMLTASIMYFIFVGTLCILNHIGLRTQLNDLGHMEQAIWQITQGNFSMPQSDPNPYTSRLSVHANVIFYFIAPFYALFPFPTTLLLLGTAAVSTAGFLLFWLAKLILKNNYIALIFGISLLLNPLVQETNLYDFHPVILALPLFLATIIFLQQKNWTGYWISILLLLFVKETLLPLVFLIGLYITIRSSKKHGINTMLITILYWIILSRILPVILDSPIIKLQSRFYYLGNTPLKIVSTIIENPSIIPALILQPHSSQYLLYLLVQGGFLAFFSPLTVLWALPNIIFNSLAPFQSRISGVYYSGIVITTMYTSAIYGLHTIQTYQPKWAKYIVILFTLQVIIISIIMSPTPYGLFSTWQDYSRKYNRQSFAHLKSLIPSNASLSTQNNIGAHFASRQTIVKYPSNTKRVNYILLHIKDPTHYDNGLFIRNAGMKLFGNSSGITTSKYYKKIVNRAFQEPDFGVLSYSSPWYLLKRGHEKALNTEAHQTALMDVSELCLDIAQDKRELKSIANATWLNPKKQLRPTSQITDEYCQAYCAAPL